MPHHNPAKGSKSVPPSRSRCSCYLRCYWCQLICTIRAVKRLKARARLDESVVVPRPARGLEDERRPRRGFERLADDKVETDRLDAVPVTDVQTHRWHTGDRDVVVDGEGEGSGFYGEAGVDLVHGSFRHATQLEKHILGVGKAQGVLVVKTSVFACLVCARGVRGSGKGRWKRGGSEQAIRQ